MGSPEVVLNEEGMREGMQIESAEISVEDKIRLIDALSETGLRRIVVGSFVSPKYTPQMARVEEIVSGFHPKPGVTYTALLVNERALERASKFSPPLTIERPFRTVSHLCDVL
ncbi:MAG TPA: citramalate synthase, partial [Dehalococcoidia bacterium]|nr:citramalate synthase [Dehalococcoidia bacterium]